MIPAVSFNRSYVSPYALSRPSFGQQAESKSSVEAKPVAAPSSDSKTPPVADAAVMKTNAVPANGNGNGGVVESAFLSGGRGSMPITRFFFIGAFIAAGSMAMRGLVEYAIPWTWTALTGH